MTTAPRPFFIARYLSRRRYRAACRDLARDRPVSAARLFRRAAEAGHRDAQAALGEAYRSGQGVVRVPTEAAFWLRQAAEAGSGPAQLSLARLLLDGASGPTGGGSWLGAPEHTAELSGLLFPHGLAVEKDAGAAAGWLRQAAEGGHAVAKAQLAWLHVFGNGVERDEDEAFRLFAEAAEAGVTEAHFGLGRGFEHGRGTDPDVARALAAYRIGAEAGHGPAQLRFGIACRDGWGMPADMEEARVWLGEAAQAGSAPASYELARLFLGERAGRVKANEPDVAELAELAETQLRAAARQDHRASLMLLASLLTAGDVLARDPRDAARLTERAAALGDVEALFVMGRLASRGDGMRLDLDAARRWYERAAGAGHAVAAYNLGVFSQKGIGRPADPDDALHWYAVAAEQGLVVAQLQYGRVLMSRAANAGERAAAFAWIAKAAANGSVEALRVAPDMACHLGVTLCQGERSPPDLAEACRWYERGADSGHGLATFNLAMMRLNGWGCEVDRAEARRWLTLAASGGHKPAEAALGRLDDGENRASIGPGARRGAVVALRQGASS